MAEPTNRSELAVLAADELSRYFRHLAGRVEHAVRSLPEGTLWVKPFPFGNSVGHLVLHLTGNLNHYIGATIAGTGYVRDRPREFTDSANPPAEELLARFQQAVAMVLSTLEAMDDQSFRAAVPENPPIQSRFGLFLVCASHMNNHIGQMSYLVQALQPGPGPAPAW